MMIVPSADNLRSRDAGLSRVCRRLRAVVDAGCGGAGLVPSKVVVLNDRLDVEPRRAGDILRALRGVEAEVVKMDIMLKLS